MPPPANRFPSAADIILHNFRSCRAPLRPGVVGAFVAAAVLVAGGDVVAQQMPMDSAMRMDMERPLSLGAQGILELSTVSPAHSGLRYTEGYLTEPALMARGRLAGGALRAATTVDLEGLTLRRGELTPGGWGEGYVDRRHPHTYVHELVASGVVERGRLAASLTAGKGFAPFGTDDPMVRPFVKYPSNHHLSQVLERAVGIASLRAGPVVLEGGIFNGDEPKKPSDFADLGRFGDSWAARATLRPLPALELQASRAFLRSPERPDKQGLDQRKWSASVRYGGNVAAAPYALLEWATTRESGAGAASGFRFSSVLAEGALPAGPILLAGRFERSTRPEEERLANPFRSPRPTPDFSIVGATRFTSGTLHARWRALEVGRGTARVAPFLEAMLSRPADTLPTPLFSAESFYGGRNIVSFSAGIRVEAGMGHVRMGRYGVADY